MIQTFFNRSTNFLQNQNENSKPKKVHKPSIVRRPFRETNSIIGNLKKSKKSNRSTDFSLFRFQNSKPKKVYIKDVGLKVKVRWLEYEIKVSISRQIDKYT